MHPQNDVEVRIAIQPRWPLEYTVGDVVCSDSIGEAEEADETDEDGKPVVVYISFTASQCLSAFPRSASRRSRNS